MRSDTHSNDVRPVAFILVVFKALAFDTALGRVVNAENKCLRVALWNNGQKIVGRIDVFHDLVKSSESISDERRLGDAANIIVYSHQLVVASTGDLEAKVKLSIQPQMCATYDADRGKPSWRDFNLKIGTIRRGELWARHAAIGPFPSVRRLI